MKRSLGIVLLGVLFASVIAGALTLSLKLLQSKNASPPPIAAASFSPSPTIVGTDHPVPAKSPEQSAANSRRKAFNPPMTPIPHASAVAESDSQKEAASPAKLVREKAEQMRERAEQLRARVEDLYQAHRISAEAYKQGQAEYQHALASYEDQIAKLRGASSGTGAANE